jgi:uncharacterized protein
MIGNTKKMIKTQHLKLNDYTTTQWSGGETTEIIIYPRDANFSERKFEFRISIATIRVEQSTFTPLIGVRRTLLLLEGALQLSHNNQHTAHLTPYGQDQFLGDWETHCTGTGTDLNVMTKAPFNARVSVEENGVRTTSANHIIAVNLAEKAIVNTIHLAKWESIWLENGSMENCEFTVEEGKIAFIEICDEHRL